MTTRFDFQKNLPESMTHFLAIEKIVAQSKLEPTLKHLIKLRVSQINGCAFCVDMHSNEARKDGESNQRLDRLPVWKSVENFSCAEKAALSWAEALTKAKPTSLGLHFQDLSDHFDEEEIHALTLTTVMINTWNRY